MNLRARVLVFLAITVAAVTFAPEAAAQSVPGVSPFSDPRVVQAVADRPLVVRLHADACAVSLGQSVALQGNVLRFSHGVDRALSCSVERDVDFTFPALPAGQYVLQYEPEGISLVCYPFVSVPFGVAPAGTVSIPMVGQWAACLLALLMVFFAGSAFARR